LLDSLLQENKFFKMDANFTYLCEVEAEDHYSKLFLVI